MSAYPSAIYSPRTKANKVGIVYDAAKQTVGFAEDVIYLDQEVVALETELGLNPKGTSASVLERIKGLRSLSDAIADTIIVKGGNVGIGTAVPVQALHVSSSAGNVNISLESPTTATGSSYLFRDLTLASNRGAVTYNFTNDQLSFRTAVTSYRMFIDSSGNVGIALASTDSLTAKLDINSDVIRLRTAKTPATSGAAGNAGDICWDASNIYVCVATNTWKKIGIATW
jgi:hypothetical protein